MTSTGHQPSASDSIGIVRRGCSSSNARNPRVLVSSTLGPGETRVTIRHDFSLLCPLCCDTMPAPPRSVRTAVCTRPYLSGGQYFGAIFHSLRSKCDFDLSFFLDWNTPATHTTLPCPSTCLLLTHDVIMRWRYPQENNKEGAAFVSNGTKHYAISVNKIIFLRTTAHHCSIGLWCQIPFEHWYRVQDRGRTWSRIQDQAAGWTLRCPRVPLGCNLDNLTRCWLLEFYQSPQHETRAPASTRDLKWTNGDPFPLRYNV